MSPLSRIRLAIVSCFGLGFLPASGTIISAIVAIFILKNPHVVADLFSAKGLMTYLPIFVISLVATAALVIATEEDYRHRIGIDHLFGMILVFAFVPATPKYVLLGFTLFRFVDIIKPWPVFYFANMKSGIGALLDDIVAGLITAGAILLIKLAYIELMSYL